MNFPYPYHWISGQDGAIVDAVRIRGDAYWQRNAQLAGALDGKKGILSFWFKLSGSDYNAVQLRLLSSVTADVSVMRQADGKWRISLWNADSTTPAFNVTTAGTYVADATWHHFLASWDADIATMQIYIDDVSAPFTHVAGPYIATIFYADSGWVFSGTWAHAEPWTGELSEFYFNMATNLDLSVVANRRKFITATKRPVGLGASGQLPTGLSPIWYHSGDAANFVTNKGSGAQFSVVAGSNLLAASNTPSTVYDPFTKFLCHLDGWNGSTQYFDSSGPVGHVINFVGGPFIATGGAMGSSSCLALHSATTDYLWCPGTSSDFAFGTGDFTVEMFLWITAYPAAGQLYTLFEMRPNVDGPYPTLNVRDTGELGYWANDNYQILSGASMVPLGAWVHVALVRSGGVTKIYINGTQRGGNYTDSTNYLTGLNRPYFGSSTFSNGFLNGFLDEIRILKGKAAYTANFTPPTVPYTP